MSDPAVFQRRPWQPGDGDGRCQQCGTINPCWWTENEIWNHYIPSRELVLCPTCFLIYVQAYNRRDENPPIFMHIPLYGAYM